MEKVQPLFSTLQASRLSLTFGRSSEEIFQLLFMKVSSTEWTFVKRFASEVLWRVQKSSSHGLVFFFILITSFALPISPCHRSLLALLKNNTHPHPHPAGTQFWAMWPLVSSYLISWETKSTSHFHCFHSLWCLFQFVAPWNSSHHIQANTVEGFQRDLGFCAALWGRLPSGAFELRKWSRCKAAGSRNPVGHSPCCSCTAPLSKPQTNRALFAANLFFTC